MKRALALAALLLAASTPPFAGAFHRYDLPLLAGGGGWGTGWASASFTTDGTHVAIDAMAHQVNGSAQAAIFLFDSRARLVQGVQFTIVWPADDGILVDTSPLADPLVHVDTRTQIGPRGSYLGIGFDIETPGTFKVLAWASGRAGSWSWAIHGASGAQAIGGTDGGTSTFLHEAGDFRGIANAQAGHGGAAARVAVEAEKVVSVKDRLYGMFLDVNFKGACVFPAACASVPESAVMSATGPLGDTRDCTALRKSVCRFVGNGPGDYTFRFTSPDAGMAGERNVCPVAGACAYALLDGDYILLGGADARLV